MACEVAEAVVGRVLVRFAERRVVEDLLDEFVDGLVVVESHQADVDEFRGAFADQAYAEKLAVGASKDEFEHSGRVADDVAAGVVFVMGAPNTIVDFLSLQDSSVSPAAEISGMV